MKNRFFKKSLYASAKLAKDKCAKALESISISEESPVEEKPPEEIPPESSKKTSPFELLFKEIKPIPEVLTESVEPKKRGRPRKVVDVDGSQTKKIDDDEEDEPREITPWMKNRMIEEFRKAYKVDQDPLNSTLTKIAARYRITYAQAYKTLEDEL